MTREETLKACCTLLVVLALPFVLDATAGCDFTRLPVSPNSYECACDCKPGEHVLPPTRVSAAFDDAETDTLDAVDLDLGVTTVGVRFVNLDIPQGATIVSATVQFTSDQDFEGDNTVSSNIDIYGIATGNAPSFGGNFVNLGAVNRTFASVGWQPPAWLLNQSGPAQQTPDLSPVIQEIVNGAGWQSGNALALIFAGLGRREAVAFDRDPARAAVLSVTFAEASPNPVSLQNLQVCVPQTLNVDEGGTEPSAADLEADCTGRVQMTLSDLALACHYPSACTCQEVHGSEQWSQTCDDNGGVCMANPIPPLDCNDFNQATNVPGDEPVCTANSPLAADVFGRRTTCAVNGTAQIDIGGNTQNSSTMGVVQFVGTPCPEGGCAVGMEYNLKFGSVTFGNFFESATFSNLAGIGENTAGNEATVLPGGGAMFGQNTLGASGQGSRGSDLTGLKGLATANQDPVNVDVGWGQSPPMCSVTGTLLGNVDPELKECSGGPDNGKVCQSDSDCTSDASCSNGVCPCVSVGTKGLAMTLAAAGAILNQPPTADAGPDQTVECTAAAVTNIVLDGGGSSDPDSNIALYSWLLGNLDGPEVGFAAKAQVQQALGTETYVLRVIDAFGQADEDTTRVNVVDTTPPVVTCSVAASMLNPPNHDLVNVGLAASSVDQCEGVLPVVVNVFGNEDDQDNTGDGVFSPDATNIAVGTLRLRAERKGNGNGRVYLIIPESTDSSGNRGFSCCTVTVPHSNAPVAQMSVQAQAAAAQAFCLENGGTPPAGYFVIGDGPVIGPKQ